VNVFGTLVYGQNAYGDIELDGNGGNVKVIINPPGSSGAADPLEQRGTIAWKVKGYCATILQDSFLVRIEHGATV
jgi:N4-gp56 family major capsid protein